LYWFVVPFTFAPGTAKVQWPYGRPRSGESPARFDGHSSRSLRF
jgi:hypothetical protein